MMQIDVIFSTGLTLTYDLNDTRVVADWVSILDQMPRDLHDRSQLYNHRHGFASEAEIDQAGQRLAEISDKYQLNIPPITRDNWHQVLNRAHIFFPNWRPTNDEQLNDSHEFNVLIHWLEYELANVYDTRREYLVNVDFNQNPATRTRMPLFDDGDFSHFSPILEFGNIHLHYVHKGRHFLELANALDFDAPRTHFVPQHRFNATFGMVFSEPGVRDYADLQRYYINRGGVEFFRKQYDNPTMAIGFYKLGQLVNVDQYRTSEQQRNELRAAVSSAVVVDWKINATTV